MGATERPERQLLPDGDVPGWASHDLEGPQQWAVGMAAGCDLDSRIAPSDGLSDSLRALLGGLPRWRREPMVPAAHPNRARGRRALLVHLCPTGKGSGQ